MTDTRHITLIAPSDVVADIKAEVHAIRPNTLGAGRPCSGDHVAFDLQWRALPITLANGTETDAWSLLQARAPVYGAQVVVRQDVGDDEPTMSMREAVESVGLEFVEVSE